MICCGFGLAHADNDLGDPPANFAVSSCHVLRHSDRQERWQINYHVPSVKRRVIPPQDGNATLVAPL